MGPSFADVLAEACAFESEARVVAPDPMRPVVARLDSASIASLSLALPAWAETLRVSPFADESDLRRAWKRRAFESHPDRGGSSSEFVAVKNALDEALSAARAPAPSFVRAASAYRR